MPVHDLYSKRQKRLRGDIPDVYTYDAISDKLKTQIKYAISDFVDNLYFYDTIYETIVEILMREHGVAYLSGKSSKEQLWGYFNSLKDIDMVLDIVEVSFRQINRLSKHEVKKEEIINAISELNQRFKEEGVGFFFESGEIIRIDSQIIHEEAVKPALHLLNDPLYKNAEQEFLAAYEHYRHKRYEDCLVNCVKSFESVMKIICDKRKWQYNSTDASAKLINVILLNNLIPTYLQNQFTSLRSLLESLAVPRNKQAGHGAGANSNPVPDYLASFMLHQTAATILMLVKAEQALP